MIPDADRAAAQEALSRLDRLLAERLSERPPDVFPELSLAVRGVVRLRNALIALQRSSGPDGIQARLAAVNRLVTDAIAAQFPMAGVQWDRVEGLRDGLRVVLDAP